MPPAGMPELLRRAVDTMRRCGADAPSAAALSSPCAATTGIGAGGIGGGPGQLPHLAPTYAGVLAMLVADTPEAYTSLAAARSSIYRFLLRCKCKSGSGGGGGGGGGGTSGGGTSGGGTGGGGTGGGGGEAKAEAKAARERGGFHMHDDGEVDVRGTYCALTVAYLLNILTPELADGAASYVARCQGFEGGFGGEPGNEGHGGYAFCATAALLILRMQRARDAMRAARAAGAGVAAATAAAAAAVGEDEVSTAALDALRGWQAQRQMRWEGGYQGRTNKLVDGCYSFWQGGVPSLLGLASAPSLAGAPPPPAAAAAPDAAGGDMADALRRAAAVLAGEGAHGAAATAEWGAQERAAALGGGAAGAAAEAAETAMFADGGGGGGGAAAAAAAAAGAGRLVSGATTGHQRALQRYILHCCQQREGGLRDKPSKPRDFYHTCYCLSGLAAAQRAHMARRFGDAAELLTGEGPAEEGEGGGDEDAVVMGAPSNLLCETHPVFNIRPCKVRAALRAFGALPPSHAELLA